MNTNEGFPKEEDILAQQLEQRDQKVASIIGLVKEIIANNESFNFPGLKEESYQQIIKDEIELQDMGYPAVATPIDTTIAQMKDQGIKVVFGDHPESGNVYILPINSDNIEMDSLPLRILLESDITDDKLKELVSLCNSLKNSN